MNTKRTRFVVGVVSAVVLSASLAMARSSSLTFANLRGTVRVLQGVPCGGVVDVTTSIADGRMEITPLPLSPNRDVIGPQFDLTGLHLFLTPFTLQQECLGVIGTADFREIGVRLSSSVRFTGEAIGGPEDRQYRFSIPKEQVLIFESVLDNMPGPQPETAYQQPSEDVTGEIDLRLGTAQLHVVLASQLHFRAGCVGDHCVIDEERPGTQTADIAGVLVNPGTDTDGDRVPDLIDNCPLVPNSDQSPVATPRLTPPPDVTLSSCRASNIGAAEGGDVCRARPVVISNNAPLSFPIGTTVVTWSATDGIDPMVSGRQSVNVIPDRAPLASCTALPQQQFSVAATDDCSQPTLKLGSYSLANGEVIQIQETARPGVRLINTIGADRTKHFLVGKGEAVIVATDAAGNVTRAACGAPLDITSKK